MVLWIARSRWSFRRAGWSEPLSSPRYRERGPMTFRAIRFALPLFVSCAALILVGKSHAQSPPRRVEGPQEGQTASQGGYLPRPPQAELPPLNCWGCKGPPPMNYCLPGCGRRGFLYYGTYPYDDDWFNGFDDCPYGSCGNPGAAIGLGWIQLHNRMPGPRWRLEQHKQH